MLGLDGLACGFVPFGIRPSQRGLFGALPRVQAMRRARLTLVALCPSILARDLHVSPLLWCSPLVLLVGVWAQLKRLYANGGYVASGSGLRRQVKMSPPSSGYSSGVLSSAMHE